MFLIISLFVLCSADTAVAQESDDLATVTYLTRSTVYVSAGAASGIAVGQLLHVVRDGAVIVDIRAETVSERRAACTPTDPGVLIEVEDTGRGILREDLPNIFDPFFTSKATGAGIGLTLVHQIVTRHGGEVTVSCDGEQGAIAQVRLPNQREEAR